MTTIDLKVDLVRLLDRSIYKFRDKIVRNEHDINDLNYYVALKLDKKLLEMEIKKLLSNN